MPHRGSLAPFLSVWPIFRLFLSNAQPRGEAS